jgi:molybdopterin-guanine dinucleotide biosynthesis protein A
LAAVVLAGGASRRMGRDKATMAHPVAHPSASGLTMVEYTVSVVAARCAPVFVIAAPGQQLPALHAQVLRDDVRGVGPLLATGRGLRAAGAAWADRAFVCAVDMPNLSTEVIDELIGYRNVDIVLPWDGRDHYLAGIYRTALADQIDALVGAGHRSMRALTDTVLTQRVVLVPGDGMDGMAALVNVNTAADTPS